MNIVFIFFVNDSATTEIYTYGHTLSLPDALPISRAPFPRPAPRAYGDGPRGTGLRACRLGAPRASPRGNRSAAARLPRGDRSDEHTSELQSLMRISYAVFCLKKKKLDIIPHDNTKQDRH